MVADGRRLRPEEKRMKLAFSGASHWHLPLYLDPVLELAGAAVVAVSDPDLAKAEGIAAPLGCGCFASLEELIAQSDPDFVFVLGRHADMARDARLLISKKLPFAVEKPCGIDLRQVTELAQLSAAAGVFAAVPLVFRNGDLWKLLQDEGAASYQYAAFRFIAGFPSRYREAGCEWMLDPALSGGGCTINLSVHFFDMCRMLMGEGLEVLQATMSNAAWGLPIEDYSAVMLQAQSGSLCLTETGYLYPAPTSTFDMHFAFRSPELYIVAHDATRVEIVRKNGQREMRELETTNVPNYRRFVFDVIDRVRRGKAPLAGLADMVPAMALVERAYGLSRLMPPR
jgi:predicted dehydrogenase